MDLYCATFVSGGQSIIEKQLKKKPKDRLRIVEIIDGLAVFESDYTPHELRQMRFFTNLFVILNNMYFKEDMSFENMFKRLINDGVHNKSHIKTLLGKHRETFKIVVAENNKTIGFDRIYLQKAENIISKDLGMRLSVREPQREIWFMRRNKVYKNNDDENTFVSENTAASSTEEKTEMLDKKNENLRMLCALRLTQLSEEKKHHRAGELNPEVAELLILESNPTPKDIILDPFCGYGGILKERLHFYSYRKAIGIDLHDKAIDNLKKELTRQINTRKNIQLIHGDFFNQDESIVAKSSVTKIITDPPWTLFRGKNIEKDHAFENNDISYDEMLAKFEFVLMKGGKAIVLIVGDKQEFENNLFNFQKSLRLESVSHILVSGKKAGIYNLVRI